MLHQTKHGTSQDKHLEHRTNQTPDSAILTRSKNGKKKTKKKPPHHNPRNPYESVAHEKPNKRNGTSSICANAGAKVKVSEVESKDRRSFVSSRKTLGNQIHCSLSTQSTCFMVSPTAANCRRKAKDFSSKIGEKSVEIGRS